MRPGPCLPLLCARGGWHETGIDEGVAKERCSEYEPLAKVCNFIQKGRFIMRKPTNLRSPSGRAFCLQGSLVGKQTCLA
jgi:hypothetical protein